MIKQRTAFVLTVSYLLPAAVAAVVPAPALAQVTAGDVVDRE